MSEAVVNGVPQSKMDEEQARRARRAALRELNATQAGQEPSKALDSSLKRHTALIKRMRQSLGSENRDQILKDIDSLTLEKYVDEIVGAVAEGILRCKTEKDVWSAVEVISALHRRFPKTFTPAIVSSLTTALAPPSRATLAALSPEQREKEDSARVTRQRPILRVCAELALVGIIRDGPDRSGGEWVMKTVRDLLSNDPSLSSLPLLLAFLKSYSRPYLGIVPPTSSKQVSVTSESGTLSENASEEAAQMNGANGAFPALTNESEELVEKEIRDRFKKMCEGYFDNVAKKLVIEHNRLQEQDKRNHEAYIRSGEIFEDRQQAYEKMTKNYEKLLASCQSLSEQLYLPMPTLKTVSQKSESIQIGMNSGSNLLGGESDELTGTGGKWEDEERRFFEEIPDLKDYVPRSVLGLEGDGDDEKEDGKEKERQQKERVEEEVRKLEEELAEMKIDGDGGVIINGKGEEVVDDVDELVADDYTSAPTPTPGTPKDSPSNTPQMAPQGPSQLLTALLVRLPDATNRTLIDQAAVDFAFLNSKAARKRLVKFMTQVPKNRTDLLPHYSRLIAILNPYMPDIGSDIVAALDDEFRYLQRKKNVVKEFAEVRMRNITFLSNLTKFRVVPPHVILHMFKVCLDDFSGTNVENLAMLLEGCGRFLLRSEETREPFSKMIELMRRKQSMQHFDQRQLLLLENAYYQCNPPERAARQVKERTPMELFIRYLIYDVLTKKTVDKVFKLLRKLDWTDPLVLRTLHKVFTKPWKLKYGHISLLAMLTYDLQRYHPAFTVGVVDQVLEDIRRGLETNVYSMNQRRVASIKFLGELYIYRLISSGIIFDTFWTLVTFGHPEGRPLPGQPCPLDMPDDFFRIRLVCVLLDTVGMCFDRGSQLKKLDYFLTFFQLYVHCKEPLPMDVEFMLNDSFEAVRPKMTLFKSFEEAAVAVDEMFNAALQDAGSNGDVGDDSGEESGGEDDDEERERGEDEDEDDEQTQLDSPIDERAPSPEAVLLKSSSTHENIGPTEDDDAEFAKELAKLVTDTSGDARKVDKKTALALWDTALPPPVVRKKRNEDIDEDGEGGVEGAKDSGVMNFTLFTKRGNKQQASIIPPCHRRTRQIAIPAESALAVQTRTAQMQDKVEQQHLKRLVLNYEQREEAEELKALEARSRQGPIKIRLAG
ncbi:transcription factor [Cerioporus squamosus]|nr:transcription factor [Cerioporus squamosus]